MNTLQQFRKDKLPALKEKLGVKNINAVPKIDKVIVNVGIGSLATRKSVKDFEEFEKNLRKITGQKPSLYKSKKAISNFKLREGLPVMLKVTMRRQRAHDFLDRFIKVVLPRIRDFNWFSEKAFDAKGNLNIGIANYNVFPELSLDDVVTPMGLQINIVTTGDDVKQSKALLEALWVIFK